MPGFVMSFFRNFVHKWENEVTGRGVEREARNGKLWNPPGFALSLVGFSDREKENGFRF